MVAATRGWSGVLRARPSHSGHSHSTSSKVPACFLDLNLDDLSGDRIAHDTGDAFEFRELDVSGKAVRINLPPELTSDLT